MRTLSIALAALVCLRSIALGETGHEAWLRYRPVELQAAVEARASLPATVSTLGNSEVLASAERELTLGVREMLGRTLRVQPGPCSEDCIVLGTFDAVLGMAPRLRLPEGLPDDSYIIRTSGMAGHTALVIAGQTERGVLYGVFALLRKISLRQSIRYLDEQSSPYAPVRWTNEWDNLNGTIERGYAGRSIFFDGDQVVGDLTKAGEYARLLASAGINGCTVNNVNANPRVISSEFLPQLARIAAAFRPWGVRISISVDFSSPKTIGHLDTFDPENPKVVSWWRDKANEIYRAIPDLAGILLKADSEGRVGPSTYGRTHTQAANVIARALKPHGGVLVYRGFVYDHHMDWRNLKNDRARAAYDNFAKLDGKFDDNVLVQIKYGPIDFQVREPVSPLIGALAHTNETLEFQVTQEYTGQQRHLCFLLPMWKRVLDFDLHPAGTVARVKEVVAGKTHKRPLGGFVAVTNVGQDANWLGHDLAMANLYAFGRIAWNPELSSREVVDEWTRLTFGNDQQVVETIDTLQLESWRVYEEYTGPLGAGGLTDIIGIHYGPGIESSERNGWGQWHRADEKGIGMDRTVATGTGYIGQYAPSVAAEYEDLSRCPDELLLFMHHVPYLHVLHSGKTVIQHIYDSHYAGATEAQTFPERWQRLRGLVDDQRYEAVLARLQYQAGHAIVWRDAVCDWFQRKSQIADAQGRVGEHAGRVEAENMKLSGYAAMPVTPWEDASGGQAIFCSALQCSAQTTFQGQPGWYTVGTEYFDQNTGASRFELAVNGQVVDHWVAAEILPSKQVDSHSSTRRVTSGVALRPGDTICITGNPDGGEKAAIDYLEIKSASDRS